MAPAEKRLIISIKQVSKSYEQGKVKVNAVNDLSLGIEEGKFTALCGPSGSCKTTFLNMIGGLDLPTEGTIKLELQELAQLSSMALSYLRREGVMSIFKQVGLQGLAILNVRRSAAIARAIVTHPAVVLADEPTANVDSENAEALLDLMEELNQQEGITFIFSTHDPRVMKRASVMVSWIQLRNYLAHVS